MKGVQVAAIDPIGSLNLYVQTRKSCVASELHLSGIVLLTFAAGAFDEALLVKIENPVRGCARCNAFVRAMEHAGGIVLENLPPTPLAGESIAAVMAQLNL